MNVVPLAFRKQMMDQRIISVVYVKVLTVSMKFLWNVSPSNWRPQRQRKIDSRPGHFFSLSRAVFRGFT